MAKPLSAAILFDSIWGGETPTAPARGQGPVIDWRELRKLLDDNGHGKVSIDVMADSSIRLW
ncbi:hypothetical protein ACIGZJ_34375 [Kitasatospora sp. NPDC052868]|uniref:hypothetical protein n=1 Tax=Kitasatospora sp. NPDC052868 TaxID=3364060 RepID=UPI0037CC340E